MGSRSPNTRKEETRWQREVPDTQSRIGPSELGQVLAAGSIARKSVPKVGRNYSLPVRIRAEVQKVPRRLTGPRSGDFSLGKHYSRMWHTVEWSQCDWPSRAVGCVFVECRADIGSSVSYARVYTCMPSRSDIGPDRFQRRTRQWNTSSQSCFTNSNRDS